MAIDLALARVQLKADNEDIEDALITGIIASAQSICEGYCNRKFYESEDDRSADFTQALADRTALITARDALLEPIEDDSELCGLIWDRYREDLGRVKQRCNGVVIDDTIIAAMLWTMGALYFDRADDGKPPEKAQRILQPYLWIGDLSE